MSGPKVASKAAGGGSAIPAADRKLISTVKEVATNHSDEEIYAMLKECNRDPNDAVQRLLSQDNFHLVKRRRDKKKEAGTSKEQSDSRQANSGNYGRGGRSSGTSGGRGAGRGAQSSRNDGSGSRSRVAAVKENGVPLVKSGSISGGSSLSYSQLVQPKASFNETTDNSPFPSSNGETLQATPLFNSEGGWPASSGYGASAALQGAWLAGSGHGTIADMLKGGGRKLAVAAGSSISGDVLSTVSPAGVIMEQMSASSAQLSVLDASEGLSYESRTRNLNHIVSGEIGTGGVQQFSSDMPSLGFHDGESSHYAQESNSTDHEIAAGSYQSAEFSPTMPQEEHSPSARGFQGQLVDLQKGHSVALSSQFNGSSHYHGLQFAESQQENVDVDWSSHYEEGPVSEAFSESIVQNSPSPGNISSTATKLHELNFRDSHSVIIPDHIRVSEADCTMLSFGSFDVGFEGLSSNSNLVPEAESHPFSISENVALGDITASMRSLSTSMPQPALLEHEQPISAVPSQNLHEDADVDANGIADENGNKDEEDISEPSPQHDYTPGYSVVDAISSDRTSNYVTASEDTESRPRDVGAVVPQYDDSTYYNDVFRPVPEMDSRYAAFSQLAASAKLPSGRAAETTAQMAPSEVVNASVYPNSNPVGGQTIPAVNNGPSALTVQHPLHPYATQPSGLPLGPYPNVLGYQYMPPGFSYVQGPYQNSYVNTSNYHQVPTAVGAGAMKFPVPQYKTAAPVVGGMHSTMSPSSLGYGGYPNSQPAANLPITSVNSSTFDDATSHQYKDNAMYLPSQQVDGPSVWLQSQLAAREAAQGSSYYNVPGQSQPTVYSRTQSLLNHSHPAAVYGGNLYHPSQSASSPSAHQLLQQHQALGSMGALGTQIGSYQNQRAQPTWAPGPY